MFTSVLLILKNVRQGKLGEDDENPETHWGRLEGEKTDKDITYKPRGGWL